MPLPNVKNGTTPQCKAKSKRSGRRCRNPVAYGNTTVCRFHGSKRASSILSGEMHPNFRHGNETQAAKKARSSKLAELEDIQNLLIKLNIFSGSRIRGPKPKG